MKQLLHLTARTYRGAKPLLDRAACADLWERLATTFETLACTLMPTHVHLFAEFDPAEALRSFGKVLAGFRKRHSSLNFRWEPLPEPEKVQFDQRHIARVIRYIHLNPCRDGLCGDPLEWEWSTHRDWIGAVTLPVVNTAKWGRELPWAGPTRIERMHDYVCSDPAVKPASRLPDPSRFLASTGRDAGLSQLEAAIPVVLRSASIRATEFRGDERRLAILAAARWTTYRPPRIGSWLDCDPSHVRKVLREAQASGSGLLRSEEKALAMTLADPRLLLPRP